MTPSPICLDTKDTDEIIETIVRIAPAFGGINLEDISAPRCFDIEDGLQQRLDIPVFHDDQHGTAIVVIAALESAARLTGREFADIRAVVSGAGPPVWPCRTCCCRRVSGPVRVRLARLLGPHREGLRGVKADLAARTNPARSQVPSRRAWRTPMCSSGSPPVKYRAGTVRNGR